MYQNVTAYTVYSIEKGNRKEIKNKEILDE